MRSVIIRRVINKIGRPRSGSPILFNHEYENFVIVMIIDNNEKEWSKLQSPNLIFYYCKSKPFVVVTGIS